MRSEDISMRTLRRLAASGAYLTPSPSNTNIFDILPDGDRRRRTLGRVGRATVQRLLSDGALEEADVAGRLVLSAEGRMRAEREADDRPHDAFRRQHQVRGSRIVAHGGGLVQCDANLAESPLAWLARRAGRSGEAFITPRQFAAGERLREDHLRSNREARVTMDWTATPKNAGRRGPSNSVAEASDAALAARDRVQSALQAAGPGLDRVLQAVCIEGRGLDGVEKGFGWPSRSAKVVLRIALERLVEHYGM